MAVADNRRNSAVSELRPTEGRVPPHDPDAERAVLSSILLTQGIFDEVHDLIRPEDFYGHQHRLIFEAVVELSRNNAPVDLVNVASWLRSRERLEQVGGTVYLAELTDATPSVANVQAYAKTVREKSRLRHLIATCQKFAAEGYGDCGEVQDFIDQAEQSVFELARTQQGSAVRPLRDAIHGAFEILSAAAKRGEAITGVPSGFTELDKRCAGLHPGDLYIVAGRPGMGKTSFVLNLAVNVAQPRITKSEDGMEVEVPGDGVAFFSLEMPREQLASRMLSSEGRVDVSKIRSGQIHGEDWNKLTEAAAMLGRAPLWLDDTPALSLLDLRAKVRRLQAEIARERGDAPRTEKLGLVVIDYLQLMSGRPGVNSREQEISEISRGLKQLAKEMKVAVIALSQLNRSVETRTSKDKRPQLSDLRESGAIEQDADTIMFIYRDEYYYDDSPDRGVAEIIVAKQRNGPTGKVKVRFESAYTRFDNLAPDDYDFDEYDDFSG